MEVAVSFRASFDSNKDVTANALYQMEKVLQKWLQDLIAKTDTEELHSALVKASTANIPTFYFWVLADIYTAREQKQMEERAQAEAEEESVGT